jgi:hypothetical protein
MKNLPSTLLVAAMASLLGAPVLAEEVTPPARVQNEYSYQYEKVQGDLSGDRILQRDRDQERLKTHTEDGSLIPSKQATQDRVRSQLKTNASDAVGTQTQSMHRFENSFTHSMGAGRGGNGGSRH